MSARGSDETRGVYEAPPFLIFTQLVNARYGAFKSYPQPCSLFLDPSEINVHCVLAGDADLCRASLVWIAPLAHTAALANGRFFLVPSFLSHILDISPQSFLWASQPVLRIRSSSGSPVIEKCADVALWGVLCKETSKLSLSVDL